MSDFTVILASASPRRSQLLSQIGLTFRVEPSHKEERVTQTAPEKVVEELSRQKAEDIFSRAQPGTLVIGADTIVACDGQILGKPKDEADARRMLKLLQGRKHQVYTGVSVLWQDGVTNGSFTFHECTEVEFYPMTQDEIDAYVETKDPMDKAGAYGIQGRCAAHIKGIEGDYNNVVGLPVGRLYQELYSRNLIFRKQGESRKKAVIFDLDGTLADTLESISYCMNRALADYGFPAIEKENYRKLVGNGAKMLATRALRLLNDEALEAAQADEDGIASVPVHLQPVFDRYMEYFAVDCMYQVAPYEGIRELLEELKKRKIAIAVCSNKPHENTKHVIEALFGSGYFDLVQGQTDRIQKKPAPDGVLEIQRKLNLEPVDILYVGDSSVDMDTGKAAGVTTAGVLWGFRDREELLAHGADVLVARPEELLSCL